jgi:RNA-binding protein 39
LSKEERRRRRDAERKKEREREALLDPSGLFSCDFIVTRYAERAAIEFDRDQRTVFTFNIPLRADEDDLTEFFAKAGKVRDIRLIMDRNSKRTKG